MLCTAPTHSAGYGRCPNPAYALQAAQDELLSDPHRAVQGFASA
jgi:hypothetical protein